MEDRGENGGVVDVDKVEMNDDLQELHSNCFLPNNQDTGTLKI